MSVDKGVYYRLHFCWQHWENENLAYNTADASCMLKVYSFGNIIPPLIERSYINAEILYLFFSFPLPFFSFPLSKLSLPPARLSRLIERSQFSSLFLLLCPSAWPASMHVFVWNVVSAVFTAALNVLNAVFSMANVFLNIFQLYPGHTCTRSLYWSTVSRCFLQTSTVYFFTWCSETEIHIVKILSPMYCIIHSPSVSHMHLWPLLGFTSAF